MLYETDGPVAIVTINRPHVRNAIDAATAAALIEAFVAFEANDSLAVSVLTGAGGVFCAGADLKALAAGGTKPAESVLDENVLWGRRG